MNKYIMSCLALTLLTGNAFCQQLPANKDMHAAVLRKVAVAKGQQFSIQYELSRNYYSDMFKKMETIKRTDKEAMIDAILPTAEVYNGLNRIDPELAVKEAKTLNVEFKTAWTLRTSLLGLFEGPLNAHDNQTLKEFEINLRRNLLGGLPYTLSIEHIKNKMRLITPLIFAYREMTNDLATRTVRSKELPNGTAEMIKQFEYLRTNNPQLVKDMVNDLFVYPLPTGWGASISLMDIFDEACLEYWAGGDAVNPKSEQTLAKEYGKEIAAPLYNFYQLIRPYRGKTVRI